MELNRCFIILLLSALYIGCGNNSVNAIESDELFIEYIKGNGTDETIARIDSLLNANNYTEHKTAILYFEQGRQYIIKQDDEKGVESLERALKLFEAENDLLYIAKTNLFLGSANAFLSKKETATQQLLTTLDITREIGDKTTEAKAYNSLAHIHFLYKDYAKAISYTNRALTTQMAEEDSMALSVTYNNLAVIYKNIYELDSAFIYNEKSLEINKLLKNKNAIAKSYNNLAQVFKLQNKKNKAIEYYTNAVKINKEHNILNSSPLRNLGDLYFKIENFEMAKKYYTEALDIESNTNRVNIKKEIYNILLSIAIKTKDFDASLIYQEKKDSLYYAGLIVENKEKLSLIENEYKLVVREKELEQAKRNNTQNRIIFISILGAVILGGLFFYQKNKSGQLQLKQDKMELEQKVLRSQMNPHFIFNALSAIQNSLLNNKPIKSATELARFAKLMRQNFDFISQKNISLSDEIDALSNYLETQKMRFTNKFTYEINLKDEESIADIAIPPMLLQPFVENAIEHGFKSKNENGKIEINISYSEPSVYFEITDNGNGFTEQQDRKGEHAIDIFKKRLKLLGNNDEKTFRLASSHEGTSINFSLKV